MRVLLRLVVFFVILLSVSACTQGQMAWSPDGSRLAFIGKDGLRFSNCYGSLGEPIMQVEAAVVRWMPNSQEFLLASEVKIESWSELKPFLEEKQITAVLKEAAKLKSALIKVKDERTLVDVLESYEKNSTAQKNSDSELVNSASNLYLKEDQELKQNALVASILEASEISKYVIEKYDLAGSGSGPIWESISSPSNVQISQDGTMLLVLHDVGDALCELEILEIKSKKCLRKNFCARVAAASFTADCKEVVFFDGKGDSKFCTMKKLPVRAPQLQTSESDSKFLSIYAVSQNKSTIFCCKDGRIIFSAFTPHLPASENELTAKQNLFCFNKGDTFAHPVLSQNDCKYDCGIFSVSPDESHVILMPNSNHEMPIVDLKSGVVENVEIDPALNPCWRNSDEVCFAKPVKMSKNKHKSDIVLHSISTGNEIVLSEEWPSTALEDILIESEKKK